MRVISGCNIKYDDLLNHISERERGKTFDHKFVEKAIKSISKRVVEKVQFVDLPTFYDEKSKEIKSVRSYLISEENLDSFNHNEIYLYTIQITPFYFHNGESMRALVFRMTY